MPITYERDDERRLITITRHGAATIDELLESVHRHASDGTWAYPALIDARDSPPPAADDMKRMRQVVDGYLRDLGPRGRVALVVASHDDAGYGVGRMYELLSDDPGFRVFRDLQAATDWLFGRP